MKNEILTSLSLLMIFLLASCISDTKVYEGAYKGEKVTVHIMKEKSLFNNYYWPRLKVGRWREVNMDSKTINNGVPYDTSMYSAYPHYFFEDGKNLYKNEYDNSSPKYVMLSLLDGRDEKEYRLYEQFFREEWKKIESQVDLNQGNRSIKLAGLVYSFDDKFKHTFFKGAPGKDYRAIEINSDGSIYFNVVGHLESCNLSEKVQMPGKKIYLKKVGGTLTADSLNSMKDANGKTIYDYFHIIEE